MTMNFPIIDLGGFVAGVPGAAEHAANQLRHALENVGFYALVNHGVDWGKVTRVFAEAERFHGQSMAAKRKQPFSPAFTGYLPSAEHVLRRSQVHRNTKADLNRPVSRMIYGFKLSAGPSTAGPSGAGVCVGGGPWGRRNRTLSAVKKRATSVAVVGMMVEE